jgi:hypothetical protein
MHRTLPTRWSLGGYAVSCGVRRYTGPGRAAARPPRQTVAGRQGLIAQFQGIGLGRVQPEQGRVGRLVAGDVGALALAQGGGVAFDVENVVLHLEGQADGLCISLQGLEFVLGTAAGQGAEATLASISAPVLCRCMYSSAC